MSVDPIANSSDSAIIGIESRSNDSETKLPTTGASLLQGPFGQLKGNIITKEVESTIVTPAQSFPQNTAQSGTILPNSFSQLRWDLALCFGMIPLSVLLFLYIYAALVSDNPPLGPLLFSPSRTLLVVTILSQGVSILFKILFSCVFDALRWHFASREKGVPTTTFLGLSPATSSLGAMKLLYYAGLRNHTWWCLQRLVLPIICILVGIILKGDITFDTVYTPVETQPVLAGLAPINIPILITHLPVAVAWIYFSTYSISILGNGNFVTGIDPVACRGPDCQSAFLPGSLQLARRLDHLNGTILNLNSTVFNNVDTILVHNAPGYQLDFYPVPEGFGFDRTRDCMTFGQTRGQGLFMCISSNNSEILAGWSVCPTLLYTSQRCFNDTSWTDSLEQATSLSIFKRYATTAYDGRNLSIRSVESISAPQPLEVNPIDLRTVFTVILTPGLTNSSDDKESIDAGLFYLGWALRAFQDEFTSDSNLPLVLLRGLLTVPIQFATMAWEWVNATATTNTTEFALPSDLETTASIVNTTYRAKAKPWTVCVFMILTALLLIWCNSMLLWILTQKTAVPNLSEFVEVDIGSKTTVLPGLLGGRSEEETGNDVVPWSTMLRDARLGNAETRAVVENLKNSNIRVAAVRSDANEAILVLVTGRNDNESLKDAENLEKLRKGQVYM